MDKMLVDNSSYFECYFYDDDPIEKIRLTTTVREGVKNIWHPLDVAKLARRLADSSEEGYKQCPDAFDCCSSKRLYSEEN